jgi:hypothetical protein
MWKVNLLEDYFALREAKNTGGEQEDCQPELQKEPSTAGVTQDPLGAPAY